MERNEIQTLLYGLITRAALIIMCGGRLLHLEIIPMRGPFRPVSLARPSPHPLRLLPVRVTTKALLPDTGTPFEWLPASRLDLKIDFHRYEFSNWYISNGSGTKLQQMDK